MPRGRPKKEPDSLADGWQETAFELYCEGASDVEVRAELAKGTKSGALGVTAWLRWMAENDEFCEAIKGLRQLSEAFWTAAPRKGMVGTQPGQINPTAWIFNMKNRFGWRDEKHIKQNVTVRDTREGLVAEAKALGMTEAELFDDTGGSTATH